MSRLDYESSRDIIDESRLYVKYSLDYMCESRLEIYGGSRLDFVGGVLTKPPSGDRLLAKMTTREHIYQVFNTFHRVIHRFITCFQQPCGKL